MFASKVGSALVAQFKVQVQLKVEKGDATKDSTLIKTLEGLSLASVHAADSILSQLLEWREYALKVVMDTSRPNHAVLMRSRLIIEKFFLEASKNIVKNNGASVSEKTSDELEELAFDWILNADRYVDSRLQDVSLSQLKDKVILAASKLLGELSLTTLDSILKRFLEELRSRMRADASSPARQEMYDVCHALRFVKLTDVSASSLTSAINFLEAVFPLRHVASEKKSRLQHALCDLLASVLSPLSDANDPGGFGSKSDPSLRSQWHSTVALLRTELFKWTTKQSKQALAGYPVVTVLTCIEDENGLVNSIDILIDNLSRQIKDKKNSPMAVLCLTRCVSCFLKRLSGRSDPERLSKWVFRSTQTAISAAIKGNLNSCENIIVLKHLCVSVSSVLPEFAFKGMIMEMLAFEGSHTWEAPFIAISSLVPILAQAPGKLFNEDNDYMEKLPPTPAALEALVMSLGPNTPYGKPVPRYLLQRMEHLLQQDYSLLDILEVGHLNSPLSDALEKIRIQCHQLHGYSKISNSVRAQQDGIAKERITALTVLVSLLDAIPFVIPSGWKEDAKASQIFMEDVPSYTIHAEASVRGAAILALSRCMTAWPGSRNSIIEGLTRVIKSILFDTEELIMDVANLLIQMMKVWETSISHKISDVQAPWSTYQQDNFDVIRHVESCGFFLLCHPSYLIRSMGLKVLQAACHLHLSIQEKTDTFRALDSNPSTSSAPKVLEKMPEKSEFEVSYEHSRSASQHWVRLGQINDQQLSSNGQSIDKFRRSFSDMITPRSGSTLSMPWQRTVSSTIREGFSSGANSPLAEAKRDQKYVFELIQEQGNQISRSCYWDIGPYSDILRVWKPVPDDCTFESCMSDSTETDRTSRWLKIVSELMRHCWIYARDTASIILSETLGNFHDCTVTDQNGRQTVSTDGKKKYWGDLYCFIIAPTPRDACLAIDELIPKKIEAFFSVLINSARIGSDLALSAIGCADKSFQGSVVQKCQPLETEYSAAGDRKGSSLKSGKSPRKDARLVHAQILCAVCSNIQPNTLQGEIQMRDSFIGFIIETVRFIDVSPVVSPDLQLLRYCLCSIARQVALQLSERHSQAFPPMLRKQLYNTFSLYTEEGQTPGLFRSELRRHIASAKAAVKPRDPEVIKHVEKEILSSSQMLEDSANLAMGAMLLGPVFDSDSQDPNGRVFTWIRRMLESNVPDDEKQSQDFRTCWAPKNFEIAQEALKFYLKSNRNMCPMFVDQCYSSSAPVANAHFFVLSDVIMQNQSTEFDLHTLIALVLSKMVDSDPQIRSNARKLLHSIERRYNPDQGLKTSFSKLGLEDKESREQHAMIQDLVVVGGLQNSHAIFQQKVSSAMAMHYEKASLQVTQELLRRHKNGASNPEKLQQTLCCLPPWLEHADFSGDGWSYSILDLLYNVSNAPGLVQSNAIQEIWRTIAMHRGNIAPVLNFLLSKLLHESKESPKNNLQYSSMECGKHIALYLSRVAPRFTVEHLITLAESDVLSLGGTDEPFDQAEINNTAELGLIKEFHHRASTAPTQQPLPKQQPLAARAAAAIAAATADRSKPFTASSFAQAIKRSTVDIIIKTGVAVADTVVVAGAAAVGTISASGLAADEDENRLKSRTKYGEYDMEESLEAALGLGLPQDNQGTTTHDVQSEDYLQPIPRIVEKRKLLSSQEGALCLLSEIVSENDEYLRPHLAELLHIAVLQLDSCNEQVCHESCQILQFLLYNLSYKILETNSKHDDPVYSSDYARVAGVIGFLQSVPEGERIWDWELPTLTYPWISSAGSVAAFVQIVANCFPFDSGLSEKWASEALKWACCSRTRHGASRSHQIYCSLSPSLTSPACTSLLFCLEKCLKTASSEGLDTGIEILCTLRVLLSNTSREKVILYPHLFAACIALLNSSVVRVGELAMAMLLELLDCLDFSDLLVQKTILSVFAPEHAFKPNTSNTKISTDVWLLGKSLMEDMEDVEDEAAGPWFALQQLLVKGLFQGDTERLALDAFASLCRQIYRASKLHVIRPRALKKLKRQEWFTVHSYSVASHHPLAGIESIIGDVCIGLAITVSSTLPWVFVKVNVDSEEISGFLQDLSRACECVGWTNLGALLQCLESDPNSKLDLDMSCRNWSREVVPIIIHELFPTYGLLVIQRLIETVQRAPDVYQRAALYILEALFSTPGVNIGNDELIISETCLIDTLALELNGQLGGCIVRVLQALSNYQGSPDTYEQQDIYSWNKCIDEIGECNKICSGALKRVAMNCPGTAELLDLQLTPHHIQPDAVVGQQPLASPSTHLLPFLPE